MNMLGVSVIVSAAVGPVQLYFPAVSKIFIENLEDLGETRLESTDQCASSVKSSHWPNVL